MNTFTDYLPLVGIGLMILSILSTIFASKKLRRVVKWSIFVTIVLQTLSFISFSGIVQKSVTFKWLGAGILIGVVFALFTKLEQNEKNLFYRQNIIFGVSYLVLLLINQLLALFFNIYIPITISISALAVGMQIGFCIVLIIKANRKNKSILAKIVLFVILFSMISNENTVINAAENPCIESAVNNYKEWVKSYNNWLANGGNYALVEPEPELRKKIDEEGAILTGDYFSGKISYDEARARTEALWRPYYLRAWQLTLEREHKSMMERIKQCETEYGISVGNIPTPDVNNKDSLSFDVEITQNKPSTGEQKPQDPVPKPVEQTPQEPAQKPQEPTQKPQEPMQNQPPVTQNGTDRDNPFVPKSVSTKDASTATVVSGFLAGLSSLLALLTSLTGGTISMPGIPVPNVPYPANIPTSPSAPTPSSPQPSTSPQKRTTTPSSSPPPKPTIGTRRDDGKIYTKNHGWQNEHYPDLNVNSINNTINNLQNDIKRFTEKGDKLRTDIAKEELNRNKSELKKWTEDNFTVKKTQLLETEDITQNTVKKRMEHEATLRKAENVAKTISYASDLALAIASGGVSTSLTAASKTITALTTAKEWAGIGATAYDSYTKGKSVVSIASEAVAGKVVNKAVGVEFTKGKDIYNIDEAKSKLLKALVAAGETSAGNVVGGAAEDMGIVENFGKGIDNLTKGGA